MKLNENKSSQICTNHHIQTIRLIKDKIKIDLSLGELLKKIIFSYT